MVIQGYLVFVIHVGFKWIKVAEYLNKLWKKSTKYKTKSVRKKFHFFVDLEEPKDFVNLIYRSIQRKLSEKKLLTSYNNLSFSEHVTFGHMFLRNIQI